MITIDGTISRYSKGLKICSRAYVLGETPQKWVISAKKPFFGKLFKIGMNFCKKNLVRFEELSMPDI